MFDLVAAARLWIPVKWPGLIPGPDEGLAVETEHMIEVEVEIIERDELLRLFPPVPEAATTEQQVAKEFEVFKRLVSGWRKFKIGGKAAEFNDTNIRLLLKQPMFATGFEIAYQRAWSGKGEAREGNSKGSPGNGRADAASEATVTTNSSESVAASE